MQRSSILASEALASLHDFVATDTADTVSTARGPWLATLLNTLACALLVVDQNQTILFANAAAERALMDGDFLSRCHDLLTTAAAERARLAQVIAAAASPGPRSVEMMSSMLLTNDKGVSRIAYVRPLPDVVAGAGRHDSPLVLLAMPVAGDIHLVHTGAFARAYGLTRTEERVLVHLVNGATLKGAAVRLQVATATVTTHVKHIFDKTGVRRQSDLICLLLRSLPPFAP